MEHDDTKPLLQKGAVDSIGERKVSPEVGRCHVARHSAVAVTPDFTT